MEGKTKREHGRRKELSESERKKRKRMDTKERAKQRIYIGSHINSWNRIKEAEGLKFHHEVAGFLIEKYEEYQMKALNVSKKERQTSTPSQPKIARLADLTLSEITVSTDTADTESAAESGISGVTEMPADVEVPVDPNIFTDDQQAELLPGTSKSELSGDKRVRKAKQHSASFLDPFNLSIDITQEDIEEEDIDDEDYEPEFDVTLGADNDEIEDVAGLDMVIGEEEMVDSESESESDESPEAGPGILHIKTMDDIDILLEANKAIAFQEQLIQLAKTKIDISCQVKGCKEVVEITASYVGSAVYLTWECPRKHVRHKWCSQPLLNRGLHSGDLLISSSILASGNNYGKIELMSRFLNLNIPSKSSFHRMQTTYLVPAIDAMWENEEEEVRHQFQGQEVVLLGDGRMDSPGYCAQYCTYTMMENVTKKIVAIKTLDKRETGKKSTNLEKAGFQRALEDTRTSLHVKEIATDAHMQIGALMKRQYPEIKHSHDVWHAAKNLGKKINAAGQEKTCKDLQQWNQDIVNHFWHCCKTANTYEEFLEIWVGVLHHVSNEHEWALSYTTLSYGKCSHGPLADLDRTDKPCIEKGSPAHIALRKIVLDKRFLNNVHYFLNFRSTSELEVFNNHILMYASKRISYSPPVYRARNILAALDYNAAVDLPPLKNKDGTIRYQRTYMKKSARWTTVEKKEKKTYVHIKDLFKVIFEMRLEDRRGMFRKVELSSTDPRRLSSTIAPIIPPPTSELLAQKKSRFN